MVTVMATAPLEDEVIQVGQLVVRPGEFLAVANGHALSLSVRELGVLVALARRGGRIVPREELYREVWGGSMRAQDRSVDVYVHKLRAKLEGAVPSRRFIHTHVGFGYRFSPEPVASHAFHNQDTAR